MMHTLVSISNLSFARGERVIFSEVNLDIPQGKITAIMGPSGTGKTTLLRLIGAELYPSSGTIMLGGQNLHALSRKELFAARRQIGMLFQTSALFTNLNVFENVAFPLRVHTQLPEFMIRDLVLMKLEAVGLRGARTLMPSELSGGMSRRVALARAAVLDPDLMMYDEPFTGLDPIAKSVVVKLIKEFNDALGLTSILVSHDVQEAASIADYVYVISSGKILAHGTPHELFRNDVPEVHQFMHGLPDGAIPFHYPAGDYLQEMFADESQGAA